MMLDKSNLSILTCSRYTAKTLHSYKSLGYLKGTQITAVMSY